jgi:hypothetical protein
MIIAHGVRGKIYYVEFRHPYYWVTFLGRNRSSCVLNMYGIIPEYMIPFSEWVVGGGQLEFV